MENNGCLENRKKNLVTLLYLENVLQQCKKLRLGFDKHVKHWFGIKKARQA